MLVGLAALSYVDRQIINLMVQPIRRDIGISDLQISLLQGIAFASFFAVFGLPLGWLVDRTQRRLVICGGLTVWSLATAASGLATGFGELFMARLMVGAGEAALAPAAYSLIADLFPRHRLALALAVYGIGASLGSALAVLLGGVLLQGLTHVALSLGGHRLAIWQLAFLGVGAPGLIVAPLTLLIPEPARIADSSRGEGAGLADLSAFIASRRAFLICHFGGFASLSALGYAVMNWLPAYVMRRFGVSVGETGYWVGAMIVCSIPGGLAAGLIIDRLFARGRSDAHLLFYLVLSPLLVLIAAAAFLVQTLPMFAVLMGTLMFLAAVPGAASASLQITTPSRLRGRVSALFLFVYQLLGLGLGPTVVALFTDTVFRNDAMVGYSMGCAAAIFGSIGTVFFALGRAPMRRAVASLAP